jgi:hypothetical protein
MPFEFLETGIPDPKIIKPILHADMRVAAEYFVDN